MAEYWVSGRHCVETVLAAALVALFPVSADAFTFVSGTLVPSEAWRGARWDAEPHNGTGLSDGVQVAVEAGFAQQLGATNDTEVELLHSAIERGFRAWENPALQFDISFESSTAQPGISAGAEIDLFAVPSYEMPLNAGTSFGLTLAGSEIVEQRLLANGMRKDGYVFTGVDILLNETLLKIVQSAFSLSQEESLAAITRLVMHEVGHAIGLGHSNNSFNLTLDTNADHYDIATIDPLDPIAGLAIYPGVAIDAIMSDAACGSPLTSLCPALFYQDLQPDDRLGRDVLYPAVPEVSAVMLLAGGLAALGAWRRATISCG